MPTMTWAEYEERYGETKADLSEDIHPALRRRYISPSSRAKCRACAVVLDIDELTDDGLCVECDATVRRLEAGDVR